MSWSVVILDDGSPHLRAFDDLARGLFAALQEIDAVQDTAVCRWSLNPLPGALHERPSGRWIVFGALRHPAHPLPYDAVLYNTEQVGNGWFTPGALGLLRKHVVWDYSAVNIQALQYMGVRAVHVPFCWFPGLERASLRPEPPVYDACFVGSLNPRRQAIIDALDAAGCKVAVVDGDYGPRRDAVLRASKVLVNVHFYEQAIHESARCVLAAANHIPVVSEVSAGGETTAGIVDVPLEQVVEMVCHLVRDDAARVRVAQEQYAGVCGLAPRMATEVERAIVASTVPAQRLVLSMIATDEPHLQRALESAKQTGIEAWCISYNGADVGEFRASVAEEMGNLPGEVIERPWVSYGHNRTEALRLAASWGSHALILDADEVVESWPLVESMMLLEDNRDGWEISELQGSMRGPKVRVVRTDSPWRYVGAVHEILACDAGTVGSAPALAIRNMRDGAGSRVEVADRYLREAEMLRADVERSADPRSQFYYAQSLDCAGKLSAAVVEYAKRAEMAGGFVEEAWMSLVRIGAIYARVAGAEHLVPGAYLRAYGARPTRAEALSYLGRWYRERGQPQVALLFLRQAHATQVPGDRLFVEESTHGNGWQVLDEMSLCLAVLGEAEQAVLLTEMALQNSPEEQHGRLRANLAIYSRSAGTPVHDSGSPS